MKYCGSVFSVEVFNRLSFRYFELIWDQIRGKSTSHLGYCIKFTLLGYYKSIKNFLYYKR